MKIFQVVFVFLVAQFLYVNANGQSVQLINSYLKGKHVFGTERDGGAIYGTYRFMNYYLCSSGYFYAYGHSEKETVLGNTQYHKIGPFYGRWEPMISRGKMYVSVRYNNGSNGLFPVEIYRDGTIKFNRMNSKIKGSANCQ